MEAPGFVLRLPQEEARNKNEWQEFILKLPIYFTFIRNSLAFVIFSRSPP